MVACAHEEVPEVPRPINSEHPVTAVLAVVAIVLSILLITWARFEVHGTGDLEAALDENAPIQPRPDDEREIDAAVTVNRFATGLSP